MRRWCLLLPMLAAAVSLPVRTTHAQNRIAITLGAGPLTDASPPPAEDFVEPTYLVSIQRVMKDHFVLDGELSYWAHLSQSERGPHTISGPSGVLGTVQRSVTMSDNTYWNLGLNFLVKSTGAVRVFGGAGVGIVMQDELYSQQDFGCSANLDPRICSKYEQHYNRGPFPVIRLLGGVEVPITNRIGAVASVRAENFSWEDTSKVVSVVAGVRIGLR